MPPVGWAATAGTAILFAPMSTQDEQPTAGAPSPEESFDELTGVYGFFRRYQKTLLYTAGLFTLLTFSITGSLQSMVGGMFSPDVERGSIEVNGVRAELTSEDYRYGGLIARNLGSLPAGVVLPVQAGEGGESELGEVFAILRRAAILEGFEPSMAEVDRAIEATRELFQLESAAKLAQRRGFSSTQEFRLVVAEAMRVGTYQRLQALAADTSDAEVMRKVLRNQKKAAYKVAQWDAAKRQEEMIAASEMTDEELKAWLDEKPEAEQRRMGVFDLPRVKLRFAAVVLGEGQFDASQWADGALKDFEVADDQLRSIYDQDLERWTEPDAEEPRSFDDEAVKAECLAVAQADKVMNDLNTQIKAQLDEAAKPFVEKVTEAKADLESAEEARSKTLQDKLTREKVLVKAEEALAEKPEDAALKAAVETAKAESQAAADADFAEEQRLRQMEAGVETAGEAVTKARLEFDFAGAFAKLTEGKTGFVVKEDAELRTSEELSNLDELGLDLGRWSTANLAASLTDAGALGFGPGRTSKGTILYQALACDPTPLKAWDDLKPLIQAGFFSKKADDEAVEKNKLIRETLIRLAKERMPEFVKEKQDGRQGRIDEQLSEWETATNADITKAEQTLATPGLGERARKIWQSRLDAKKTELAGREGKLTSLQANVDRDIENEINAEATKYYKDVLDAAAAECGYEVLEIGPLPRKLSSRPRFDQDYDDVTVYVFRYQAELDEGVAVGPIYQSRTSRVIVCTKVEDMESSDVTRREFELLRKNFALRQMSGVMGSAFTQEALAERYHLEKPVGELVEPQ
jgi:hypothetical protein